MTSGPVVTPDRSFDALADQYERVRPGYPESVVDRILDFAQLSAEARLLEVGTGTAKATVAFARRGFRILALEPGPNLAQIARSRLANFREVEVRTVSLEDWQLESRAFDLAFVAQAFHWLPREQRLPKLAFQMSAIICSAGSKICPRPSTLLSFPPIQTIRRFRRLSSPSS